MEDYEFKGRLGRGSFGSVVKAVRKRDGKLVAIKEIDYSHMDYKKKKMLVNEVNALKALNNEHIVKYYDRFIKRDQKLMYIIMEYCEQGDLQNFIRETRASRSRIPENQIWQTLMEMCLALKDCHYGKTRMIHRDIKPGNIFIDKEGHIKLGDFGLARDISNSLASTCAGTPLYMSPEQTAAKPLYDEKSDIWALGCVIFEMADLNPPFMIPDEEKLKRMIRSGQQRKIPSMYSQDLWNVICMMLEKDPAKRPTVLDLLKMKYIALFKTMNDIQKERAKYKEETAKLQSKLRALTKEYNEGTEVEGRVKFAASENDSYFANDA